MNEYRDAVLMSQSPVETAPTLTLDERWGTVASEGSAP